jgi:hypothetical protein
MNDHVYEKTRQSNPNKLTVNQHILPRMSIERFINGKGVISVYDKVRSKKFDANPGNGRFCTSRAWGQATEANYMKNIECSFQKLADNIIGDCSYRIGINENNIINSFFALWYVRATHKNVNVLNIKSNTIKSMGDVNLTKEQEENLESNGYIFGRNGGQFPARFMNGITIMIKTNNLANKSMVNEQWGIIHAQEGQFVVPDVPYNYVVPLTPTLCFMSPSTNGTITKHNVAEINRSIMNKSHEYYFANDLSECPF